MLLYIHETFLLRNSLLCPEGIQEIFTSKGGILTVLQTDKGGGEDQEEESFFPLKFFLCGQKRGVLRWHGGS